MNPAHDQYGSKITTVHVGHGPPPASLPNTGLSLTPFVILGIILVLAAVVLLVQARRTR